MDKPSLPAGFVKINPGMVKTTEIIDYGHLKFERKMCFKIQTLKAFHCIGSGVGLGK